jgi:pyridoxal phosphate enzyme (YggS family)
VVDQQLAERYHSVTQSVAQAIAAANRDANQVTTIVVTKFHPAQLVLDLLELGARDFGENKDQEAAPKAAQVRALDVPDHRWHFVGQLQTNKVKSVLNYASAIHSLDRESLLGALVKEVAKKKAVGEFKDIDVFIELNLTDDPERGGMQPADLTRFATSVLESPGVNLVGVMGVASLDNQLEADFERIRLASEALRTLKPEANLISAGMSGDFGTAIQYGATHLRIGTAITGPRQYN